MTKKYYQKNDTVWDTNLKWARSKTLLLGARSGTNVGG